MKQRLGFWLSVALASVALGGCGFTPLYADFNEDNAPGVMTELSSVAIGPLTERQGMRLHQVLRENLQPRGQVSQPRYNLVVGLTWRVEELGIRRDATSSRANYILSANFALSDAGRHVYGDQVQAIVSYNILDDQYATVASEADAEERAIREAGQEIKMRLAVFFKKRVTATASAAP